MVDIQALRNRKNIFEKFFAGRRRIFAFFRENSVFYEIVPVWEKTNSSGKPTAIKEITMIQSDTIQSFKKNETIEILLLDVK